MKPSVINLFVVALLLPITVYAAGNKADIAVTDITADSDCYVVATFKNVGTTPLPASAMDNYLGASFKFKFDGKDKAEYSIGTEKGNKLKQPGDTYSYTCKASRISGTVQVDAIFNTHNSYEELNPSNNTLQKPVTCAPKLPDLKITSLDFTSDCRPRIKVENVGTGPLSDSDYMHNTYLQRMIDSAPGGQLYLQAIDPAKKLKSPGASVEWIDAKEFLPQQSIEYTIKRVKEESDTTNNTAKASLPDQCRKLTPIKVPDLIKKRPAPQR
ncbi:MAG: hypothetical protein IPQ16_13890 [Geobacteraceae bacterium]|nr:hypothetical protein [Geobacteraceae bacterium]